MIVEAVFGDIPIVLSGPEDAFKLWRFFELKTFLPGLLHVEDKLGMAHGVETRFPMLDNDVVVYSLSLNISHLIPTDQFLNSNAKPYIENNQGKLLLRQVIKRYLPSPYSERRKRGFTGPNNSWYRLDSGALLKAELYDREAPVYDVLDFKAAQLVLEDHISGRQNHHRLIWSLLSLNQWCKTFF